MKNGSMDTTVVVHAFKERIARLTKEIERLEHAVVAVTLLDEDCAPSRLSEEGKKAISQAAKKRWKTYRRNHPITRKYSRKPAR